MKTMRMLLEDRSMPRIKTIKSPWRSLVRHQST
ncbi:hypothetical protein LINPERHAP1_LOCUS4544 [Linum perenne]